VYGRRARIGVLVPPGNPTVEPELYMMVPAGVSIHFARLEIGDAPGTPGSGDGMEEQTRAYLEHLDAPARTLGLVRPSAVVLAHTAVSYLGGFAAEQALVNRVASLTGAPALTAARAVRLALQRLGAKRIALATPYPPSIGASGRAYWEAAGFAIVSYHRLEGVANIYAESQERAYELARLADVPDADAVLLSGTGLPTVGVLEELEGELRKPVVSSNQAALWAALRQARVTEPIHGFGRLLREP
jgi:maleate cis-trans isomerase